MTYNSFSVCPINEAFTDPINARKIADGQMVFRKYDPNADTQPQHFANYLCDYSPRYPPPPGPGQNYNNYPRSNLR